MVTEGDPEDNLELRLRWPTGYSGEEGQAKLPPLQRRKAPPADPPASRQPRDTSSADAPSQQPRKRSTRSAANPDMQRSTSPSSSQRVLDDALRERVDLVSERLAAATEQISTLNERTVALHDLVSDHLTAPGNSAGRELSAPSGRSLEAHGALTDETIIGITKTLAASDKALRRLERLTSALSVEVAEIGQAISDQVTEYSSATTDEVRKLGQAISESTATVTKGVEGLATAVADSYDRPLGTPAEGLEDLVEGTSEAVIRIETLVEALVEASDARPSDISEYSARTLERLGLTVGSRFEANTTTAVEAINETVNQAIDRAIAEFKEVAPPLVDRSSTAAITRLEDRVAELTRQRDEHDRETKGTLNGLEETVGRLASAQAEDLERIVDTIEAAASPGPITDKAYEGRLARIESSLVALSEAAPAPTEFGDVAEQFAMVNKQLTALRRRLPIRGRATAAGLDEQSMEDLAVLIANHVLATTTASSRATTPARLPARTSRAVRPTKPPSSTKAGQTRSPRRRPDE